MSSRSFPILIALLLGLVGLALPLGCVNTDQIETNPATITTHSSIQEIDTAVSDTSPDVATQSVTISGRTATVDGISLAEAWVAIADDATQQLVSETTSDQNGDFTITLTGAVGDYDVLAAYQDDDVMLIGWQGFSLSDEVQDYQFDLALTEAPTMDEGAAPPPSGGCYLSYSGRATCINHVQYRYACWAGSWYCYFYSPLCSWYAVGSC